MKKEDDTQAYSSDLRSCVKVDSVRWPSWFSVLTLCIIILRARHDHNKIAPCGMITVFLIELIWAPRRPCSD